MEKRVAKVIAGFEVYHEGSAESKGEEDKQWFKPPGKRKFGMKN